MNPVATVEAPAGPDPKIAERRRKVEHDHRRRRRRWLAGGLCLLTGVVGLWALSQSAIMDVNEVAITGAQRLDPADVQAAAGVGPGDPLVGIAPSEVANRVAALPAVATASVERDWWKGRITIAVTERVPAVALAQGSGFALADAQGRVVAVAPDAAGLPQVEGIGPVEPGMDLVGNDLVATTVAAALPPGLASAIESVRHTSDLGVVATLVDGGDMVVGEAVDLDTKVVAMQTFLATVDLACLVAVDFRVAGSAVATREAGCVG